jgi:Sulfotransferase family
MIATSPRSPAPVTGTSPLRRPNLFLIGSMKSGSTYLSALLATHPAVFVTPVKEPCYFVDQRELRRAWPHMWRKGYWRRVEHYLALFAAAGEATVIAEASNFYSQVPAFGGVPERILSFSPDARFVYIMRDPVERTISHYWHRVRWSGEHRPLLAALRADPQYTDTSYYARQLSAYLQHVGRERIYTLTLEGLAEDMVGEMSRLYAWLGVDASFRPAARDVDTNMRPDTFERVRGRGLLDRLRRTPAYWRVAPYLPSPLRTLARSLALRTAGTAEAPLAQARSYLRTRQLDETEELGRILGRGFPEWKTLRGCS